MKCEQCGRCVGNEKPCEGCAYNTRKHWLKTCIECSKSCKFTEKMKKAKKSKQKAICPLCGQVFDSLEEHHLTPGKNRAKADQYRLVLYICWKCHSKIHGSYWENIFRKIGQLLFERKYKRERFIEEFGRSYLDKGDSKRAEEILAKLESGQVIFEGEG